MGPRLVSNNERCGPYAHASRIAQPENSSHSYLFALKICVQSIEYACPAFTAHALRFASLPRPALLVATYSAASRPAFAPKPPAHATSRHCFCCHLCGQPLCGRQEAAPAGFAHRHNVVLGGGHPAGCRATRLRWRSRAHCRRRAALGIRCFFGRRRRQPILEGLIPGENPAEDFASRHRTTVPLQAAAPGAPVAPLHSTPCERALHSRGSCRAGAASVRICCIGADLLHTSDARWSPSQPALNVSLRQELALVHGAGSVWDLKWRPACSADAPCAGRLGLLVR